MNSDAAELIATKLRVIRQINDDAQQQQSDHYKQSVARVVTEIVAVLEMLAPAGYQKSLHAAEAGDGFRLDKKALSGSDRVGEADAPPEPEGGSF